MEKLLFTELRILVGSNSSATKQAQENLDLQSALLDNDNLKALGYSLKFEGLVKLAKDYSIDPEMKPLYKKVKKFNPEIEVSPMYPNFPKQVMETSELELRVNQVLHYASTYGLMDLFGVEITRGWLPETKDVDKRFEDKTLLETKTLDYVSREEASNLVVERLIERKERLLPKELELAKMVIFEEGVVARDIPFKENIGAIFTDAILSGNKKLREIAMYNVASVVRHPGDVLDVLEAIVVANKYKHLRTSVKRSFVSLLESFDIFAIEENLASNKWSNNFLGRRGKARAINRNIALVDYLSFNRFSKRAEVKELVGKMKSGELLSWNQKLERAYDNDELDKAVSMLTERPGVYFRQLNRLNKLGADHEVVNKDMNELGKELKTQSIVSAINNYEGSDEVVMQFKTALISNLMGKDIEELKGKNVFIQEDEVVFDDSRIEIIDKFEEGGYIGNGMAIRIPKDIETLRFFTYWNDERQIDIDLHAAVGYGNNLPPVHVGWNGVLKHKDILVHSGDITHSNAAEYLDLNMSAAEESGVEKVQFNINSYTGVPFVNVDEMFAGIMAVSQMKDEVELYDSKNVFFRHDIQNRAMAVDYAYIDIKNRIMYILGSSQESHNDENLSEKQEVTLSITDYLKFLTISQGATITDVKDEADIVLGLAKADEENYVSLIDKNFFM